MHSAFFLGFKGLLGYVDHLKTKISLNYEVTYICIVRSLSSSSSFTCLEQEKCMYVVYVTNTQTRPFAQSKQTHSNVSQLILQKPIVSQLVKTYSTL
jgi:hypothetical protein